VRCGLGCGRLLLPPALQQQPVFTLGRPHAPPPLSPPTHPPRCHTRRTATLNQSACLHSANLCLHHLRCKADNDCPSSRPICAPALSPYVDAQQLSAANQTAGSAAKDQSAIAIMEHDQEGHGKGNGGRRGILWRAAWSAPRCGALQLLDEGDVGRARHLLPHRRMHPGRGGDLVCAFMDEP
jgi:hypothetical protein